MRDKFDKTGSIYDKHLFLAFNQNFVSFVGNAMNKSRFFSGISFALFDIHDSNNAIFIIFSKSCFYCHFKGGLSCHVH